MNEENNVVKPEKKKKRSFWWLWLLLILAVFAGGVVLGLKLNTMPMPYEIVGRYFPQLVSQSEPAAVGETEAAPAVTPAPTEAPVVSAPEPAPTEAPMPEETLPPDAAEAEPAAEEAEETPAAAPAPEAEETPEPKESAKPVFGKKDREEPTESAQGETSAAQAIGIDRALKAALDAAGVKESDAEVSGVFKTVDVDTTVYQVEFTAKGTAYEYRINAATGELEGWRTERVSQAAAEEEYYYPNLPDVDNDLFPAINRAKKSR